VQGRSDRGCTRFPEAEFVNDERQFEDFIRDSFETRKGDLAVHWQRNRRSEPGSFEAKTTKDHIRENVRDSLWHECVNFINDAAPEEQHILNEILSMWRSSSRRAAFRNDEISLGDCLQ